MSHGQYRYDYGDTTKLTPLVKMYTLGHNFMPPGIHAGGLRYHGMAPMVSLGAKLGLIEAAAFHQTECFEAAQLFAQTEGIIPAPETSHAICGAVKEAVRCREENEEKCIVFNLSGHGLCDMASYDRFLGGHLEDYAYPREKIEEALAELPVIE
jgi:tryptophan synthase beta chain